MEPVFLYQQWLRERILEYLTISCPPQLEGRIITMTPRQYGTALMQAYLGKFSMDWVGIHTSVKIEELQNWRKETEYLLITDWSKALFSSKFKEDIILRDYDIKSYHEIGAEFSVLEESLRVRIRIPLYHHFKKLGQKMLSHHKYNITIDCYDLNLFRRLFLFFYTLEYHWPSPARNRIYEEFSPMAKNIVWPLLSMDHWIARELTKIQKEEPIGLLIDLLEDQIEEIFDYLPDSVIR